MARKERPLGQFSVVAMMTSRWQWLLRQLTRRLWFRAGLLSVLAIATALVALPARYVIPSDVPGRIGADSVDSILNILATSMLAVTTFSLTTMVAAYGTATTNATPRATKLMIEDPTSQNVLATFVGSFLYSLVGIIALSTGVYGDEGRVVLFVVTIAVIALIVVTLLKWIDHLTRLGRVGDTTDRVEKAAQRAIDGRIQDRYLGGAELRDPERDIPAGARPLFSEQIGYVQHVDVGELSSCAEEHDGDVYVTAPPGTFVAATRPLAFLTGFAAESADARLRAAFTVAAERSFDQDPRFCLAVLAEIASRALSPAVNDAGTAIDVIGRSVRLLSRWAEGLAEAPGDVPCPRVRVPALVVGDAFDDVYTPIARDGAALVEVQLRLHKALLMLASLGQPTFARHAARHARLALARAEAGLELEEDKDRVRAIAALTIRREHPGRREVAASVSS